MSTFTKHENFIEMNNMLAGLSKKCKGDRQLQSEVELAIYHFPGVVTTAHKRRDTPPHCIFAVDNLVRKAVHGVLRIFCPDTATQLGSVDEENAPQTLTSPKPMPTKSVSWASSATSSYDSEQQETVLLRSQLKDAMKSNLELLEELVELRTELTKLLTHDVLEQKSRLQEAHSANRVSPRKDDLPLAPDLSDWLGDSIDSRTIEKIAAHQITLDDFKYHLTHKDLEDLGLKIGPRCRLWAKISNERKQEQ